MEGKNIEYTKRKIMKHLDRCAKSGKSIIFLATFSVIEFRKLLLLIVVHTQCLSAKGYNLINIEIIDTHTYIYIYIYICVCVFSVYVCIYNTYSYFSFGIIPLAKNGASDPNIGRSLCNGVFEITRHTHTQFDIDWIDTDSISY